MSNIFQIKRGNGAPSNGALKIGELGLDLNTNTLYVGQATDQLPSAAAVIPFAKVALSSFGSQTANYVLAAPNGSNGTPTFRALVANDIPNLNASKITDGTFDTARIPDLAASKITSGTLAIARGGTGAATAAINTVFAGPSSGSTAAPSFRALVGADIPGTLVKNTEAGSDSTTSDILIGARSQAGRIYFYSNGGSSPYNRGIYVPAHGSGAAKAIVRVDADNNITFATGTYGGITTGTNPLVTKSSGATYFSATRSDTETNVWFGVASSGTNHGVYSTKQGRWLIYGDATDVYVAGSLYHKITIGTADPSGGSDGDVYIKYTT